LRGGGGGGGRSLIKDVVYVRYIAQRKLLHSTGF